jgi:hypothetical protein
VASPRPSLAGLPSWRRSLMTPIARCYRRPDRREFLIRWRSPKTSSPKLPCMPRAWHASYGPDGWRGSRNNDPDCRT